MARPSKKNPTGKQIAPARSQKVIERLRHAFSVGSNITNSCFYAGITHQTYLNWKKADPKLFKEFERLREKPVLKARQVIMDSLAEGDVNTAKWFLERVKRDEFGGDINVNINKTDTKVQRFEIVIPNYALESDKKVISEQ